MAKRGFWPGLCVSLKHNSRFASFTMLAKGDYPAELDIRIPFSLVSNDVANDRLLIMPAYWFMYNMYALERNTWKYKERDLRINKFQNIEYEYLAPDTINEIFESLKTLKSLHADDKDEAIATGWENNHRAVVVTKISKSIHIFKDLICLYGTTQLISHIEENNIKNWSALKKSLKGIKKRNDWMNVGGQLIPATDIKKLISAIRTGKIKKWEQVHDFYVAQGKIYHQKKRDHALASLLEVLNLNENNFSEKIFKNLLSKFIQTREWMMKEITHSREKDHTGAFRKMMYETQAEMDSVVGALKDNAFIKLKESELKELKSKVSKILADFSNKK
jgi:hypothetical protein